MDRDVKALKIYCPNKKDGCGWIGEIARVNDHVKECKISCRKCKQIVYFSTMKSHLVTECPCYCPYCDITAVREVISSEHKKCCKFPTNNIEVDNDPQDKFDIKTNKINELQSENFGKIIEMFNPNILVELHKEISTIRKEVAQSIEIAKECSEKVDKQNDATMLDQLCNIRSYLTIAVLIIAILIALLLQSPHGTSEDQMVEHLISLQVNISMITSELHNISLLVSKLQATQHNTSLFNNETIRGMDGKLNEAKEQCNLLQDNVSRYIITELHNISLLVSKLQATQHNTSLFNNETIRGMDDKLNEAKEQWNSLQDNVSRYIIIELHNISLLVSNHINNLNVIQHKVNETKELLQVKLEDNITELHQQIILLQEILNRTVAQYHYQLSDSVWPTKLWLSSDDISNQVAPVIVKMSSFTKKVMDKEEWWSNPFFAFGGGYQMCLKVFAAGYGDDKGTHVSVYLYLMKGPHDDKLEQSGHWPLRGTFTIELLNQLSDSNHYSSMVQFLHDLNSVYTNRVLEGVKASGWGIPQFISHDTLFYHSNNRYHKSDFLIFRISYEGVEEATYQVTPVSFKITIFSQWFKNNEEWYSNPFFAFDGGYQMCLNVVTAGYGDGEGTHVSVFLHLMKGPHDDKLEQSGHWPLRGTFTIELLNQLNDSDHYSHMVQFHHHKCNECTNRVLTETKATGWGISQFISHETLLYHNISGYYKSDSLIFRISYEYAEPLVPVTFKVTHFSQRLKHNEEWYSGPFFAFDGGYKVYLNVDPAGYGNGKGTHVSVFLFLMKGPHDDKLEQSGHWPLRGTFTIELLNQLNDSNHCHSSVKSDPSESVNRVMDNNGVAIIQFVPKFISHDILFQHNGYLKNDLLNFRVSYVFSKQG